MPNQMTFKIESNGDAHYYVVDNIFPLSLEDFDNKISRVKVFGEEVRFIKGQAVTKVGYFYFDVNHTLTKNAFILSDGGWLPPSYCISRRFLLDRNVVSAVERGDLKSYSLFLKWFDVIKNSSDIHFSTIFSSIEKFGEFPDFSGFKSNIVLDFSILNGFFNSPVNIEFNDHELEMIYGFIKGLRIESLSDFIVEASRIIIKQRPEVDRMKYAQQIIDLAKNYKLNGKIHLVILCLSCLYAKESSFARNIIKPKNLVKGGFGVRKKALNCVNDTIFIDLVLFIKKYFNMDFSGITFDKSLAQYWCALNPKLCEMSDKFKYDFDISSQLFNTASQADLDFISYSICEI